MLICDNVNMGLGVGEVKVPTPTPTPYLIHFPTPTPAFGNFPTQTGTYFLLLLLLSQVILHLTLTLTQCFFTLVHVQSLTWVDDSTTASLNV